MSRPTEDEREALKQAALAATPILERLRREREELNARILRFENIVAAAEDTSGRRTKRAAGPAPAPASNGVAADSVKIRRGQAAEHIDAVLKEGGDYSEPELRKQIADRFHITYSRATIYTVLRRGLGKRYDLKDKRRWRMRPDA